MSVIHVKSVVKGFHVYKRNMIAGEVYQCFTEKNNIVDKYAVAVVDNKTQGLVGHVPMIPVRLNEAFSKILEMSTQIKITWLVSKTSYNRSNLQTIHDQAAKYTTFKPALAATWIKQ